MKFAAQPGFAPVSKVLAPLLLVLALPAQAVVFTFEDATLSTWLSATTGGSGSTSVQLHNNSQMAYVQHTGSLTHSLSHDFVYVATDRVSFDMHAVANPGGRSTQAYSGVTLSFLNGFNVSLGSVGLYNTTNPSGLGAHQLSIDNLQHSYDMTMASFATAAGIGAEISISKIGISFVTYAERSGGGVSAAAVWFDNVNVVPEPGQWALMLAGLSATGLALARRRRCD